MEASPSTEVKSIPSKKHGRPLSLVDLDTDVQWFIKAFRVAGTPINTAVIIAATEGIVKAKYRTLLIENGDYVKLTKTWAASLMECMKLSK